MDRQRQAPLLLFICNNERNHLDAVPAILCVLCPTINIDQEVVIPTAVKKYVIIREGNIPYLVINVKRLKLTLKPENAKEISDSQRGEGVVMWETAKENRDDCIFSSDH